MDALYIALILLLFAGCEMIVRLCQRLDQSAEPDTAEPTEGDAA